jgi:iron complex outermembrane recepter protein
MKTLLTAVVGATLALASVEAGAESTPGERQVALTIESTSLAAALDKWAQQSGFQIFVQDWEVAKRLTAPSLSGTFSAQAALDQLLEGTSLTYVWLNDKAVSIRKKTGRTLPAPPQRTGLDEQPAVAVSKFSGDGARGVSEAPGAAPTSRATGARPLPSDSDRFKTSITEEVIVTGTHIRHRRETASPEVIVTRNDIDRTGAATVGDYMKRVPQNLANGSDTTMGSIVGGGDSFNTVEGSAVNLRGLGSDATLVLVNGRRLAPGNMGGNFVDISLIPLAALERVDILTDGSSAIYGSDAVGGVVNFIMRRDFEGSETRIRYGAVESGGRHDTSIGQTLGSRWSTGSGLISYEYFDATALSAADRGYTRAAGTPTNLLPPQTRHSAFIAFNQELNERLDVFLDGTFSKRSASGAATNELFSQRSPAETEAYTGAVGGRLALAGDSQLEVAVSHGDSNSRLKTVDVVNSSVLADSRALSIITSVDAKLDGTLLSTGQGPLRYAVGAQYRDESFRFTSAPTVIDAARHVTAFFAELQVPLIGPRSGSSADRLSVSLAGRNEKYSDFGSSTSPQVGLIWRPLDALRLRGTLGKSFRAPLLVQLVPRTDLVFPIAIFDPTSEGALAGGTTCDFLAPGDTCTNVIEVFGGSRGDLRAQTSTAWTIGMDFQPVSMSWLRASLSYYHIKFKDRIADPTNAVDSLLALEDEQVLGPAIIQRNPPAELIQALAVDPTFQNPLEVDLSTIGAVVDARTTNLSVVATSGVDASLSLNAETAAGRVAFGVDATYIFEIENQFTRWSPPVRLEDTPYNPVNLIARAHASLTRGPLMTTLYVNYTDDYVDSRGQAETPIGSWTTLDLTAAYRSESSTGLFSGTTLSFTINNLTGKHPPFVLNTGSFSTLNYDGVNANPLGRYYSMQLSKQF